MPPSDTTSDPLETAYVWDIASDRLEWKANAAAVLGVPSLGLVATGEEFAARIAPEHQAGWRSAVLGARAPAATPDGIAYRVQFALAGDGPAASPRVWLEDTGRWWPGADGRPLRAHGVLRRIDARYLEDRHLLDLAPDDGTREGLNRTRLFDALGAHLKRTRRAGHVSSLLMISVHGLDAVNARLGPDIGDELVTATGRLVRAGLSETDIVVRYASNTFAAVLDGCGAGNIDAAAHRLVARIESATIETSAGPLKAAIAVGGVTLPEPAETAADAIACARGALEQAKRAHRSQVVVHHSGKTTDRERAGSVAAEIISAIEENRLLLALQPIVEAATGKTAFYEALLRLKRRDGTLVAAVDFVEEAEQLGLARLLDLRALELALALLIAHPGLRLCLNVSSLTAGDRDWMGTLRAHAAHHPGLARRLTIEITETAMIHDLEGVRAFVEHLRQEGCRIAIDDFGTGYTSFRHLKTLPVDMLKIDGLFIKDLPNDRQGRVIVGSMIEMARGLGLETVAEWVSDRETADVLAAAGATYLQGFLFATPTPAEELERRGTL